ncbi:MAG: serine hydrolase [Defluviitaleaceae bacterium]|nr:serine hydrolase [Defluviitaleaceae bacterium]
MKKMMKRALAVVLAFFIALPGIVPARAQEANESLPLRFVFESNDAQVDWVNRQIVITLADGDAFVVTPGASYALRNGDVFPLDVPVYVIDGVSFIATSDALRMLVGEGEFSVTVANAIALTEQLMQSVGAMGVTVAFVDAETGFTFTQGFGYADSVRGVAVNEHTLFQIGSKAKTFTAIAVMQLVEAGLVDLDNPVVYYLPDFNLLPAPDGSTSDEITVRMLLSNTSGMVTNFNYGFLSAGEVHYQGHVNSMLEWLATQPLNFASGTAYEYANAGWVVLSILVASVSGHDNYFEGFNAHMDEAVLAPLGMERSMFLFPAGDANVAMPYFMGQQYIRYTTGSSGAGAMLSSAHDMALYMHAILGGGGGLLSADSIAYMTRSHTPDMISPMMDYGLGFVILRNLGFETVGHDGLLENFGMVNFMCPETGIGVFVASNDVLGISIIGDIASTILMLAIGEKVGIPVVLPDPLAGIELVELDPTAVPVTPTEAELEEWAAFLGMYDFDAYGFFEFAKADGAFFIQVAGLAFPLPLVPMSDGTFASAELQGRFTFEERDGISYAFLNQGGIVTSGPLFELQEIIVPESLAPWLGTYQFVPAFPNELPLISEIMIYVDVRGIPIVASTQRLGTTAVPLVERADGAWVWTLMNAPLHFNRDADGNAYFEVQGAIYARTE